MLLLPPSILAFCLFGLYGIFRLSSLGRRPKDLPLGPPTIPLIGNLHQVLIWVEISVTRVMC